MKAHAPATERNRAAILGVLQEVLPASGLVLEIASGTGQHAAFFATALPRLEWQPSDGNPEALSSIEAWRAEAEVKNMRSPLLLDVMQADWGISAAAAVLCCNMIHIAPWTACEALMMGAARILEPGGVLYLYGPFIREGVTTAPSNLAFDASLRSRDVRWGIRRLEVVSSLAEEHGLSLHKVVEMPANNLSVVFGRR